MGAWPHGGLQGAARGGVPHHAAAQRHRQGAVAGPAGSRRRAGGVSRAQRPPGLENRRWRWGPFPLRPPFLPTRPHRPEVAPGPAVATATGLALVPILVGYFGMSFEEAIAASLLVSTLIVIALWVFGDPYAPGWITPALPLVLAFVLARYDTPTLRFQAMTAMSLSFALLVFVLGITRAGPR